MVKKRNPKKVADILDEGDDDDDVPVINTGHIQTKVTKKRKRQIAKAEASAQENDGDDDGTELYKQLSDEGKPMKKVGLAVG
jgi:hypothetical protein